MATQKCRSYFHIEIVEHLFKQVERFNLVDHQRIFLLIRCVLNRLAQLVKLAEMFFPEFVDRDKKNGFFPFLDNRGRFALKSLLEIYSQVEHTFSVGHRNHDLTFCSVTFNPVLDNRIGYLDDTGIVAFKGFHGGSMQILDQFFFRAAAELFCRERHLYGKNLEHFKRQILIIGRSIVGVDQVFDNIPEHIVDVHADTFAKQGVMAARVDVCALLVHHVIILQKTFTDTEVVFFYSLLGILNGVVDHFRLDHLSFLKTEAVEHAHHAVGHEQTHQLIFKRHVEHRGSRVTLTAGTSAQLTVNAARFVAFCTDDGQTTGFLHLFGQLDVGTAACHVGGDGHCACLTGECHDVSFFLMELGVEDIVGDVAHLQHARQQLGDFN